MNNEQPILLISIDYSDPSIATDTKRVIDEIRNVPEEEWTLEQLSHGLSANVLIKGRPAYISLHNAKSSEEEVYHLFSIGIYLAGDNQAPDLTYDIHEASLCIPNKGNIVQSIKNALGRLIIIEPEELDQIPGLAPPEPGQSPYARLVPLIIHTLYQAIPPEHRDNQNPNLWAWYIKDSDEWSIEIYQPAGATVTFDEVVSREISSPIPRLMTMKRSTWGNQQTIFGSPSCTMNNAAFDSFATLQAIASLTALKQRYSNPKSDSE